MKTHDICIIGGTYIENCNYPYWFELYGSGLRAAKALSTHIEIIKFVSCIGKDYIKNARSICNTFKINSCFTEITETISFSYEYPLCKPYILPLESEINIVRLSKIKEDAILYYGMLEAEINIEANYCVYDPQNIKSFNQYNSGVKHLAVIMNYNEACTLYQGNNSKDISKIGFHLLESERAEVIVIKNGVKGAYVFEKNKSYHIPVYKTSSVWPIGSGDIFTAAFALKWMIEKKTARYSALFASQTTAIYCQNIVLPITASTNNLVPSKISKSKNKIYIAGPFFNISDRWLINEVRNLLINFGNTVFSPLHDVQFTDLTEIAKTDLQALKDSDVILGILSGQDPGTIFEIGFARGLGKKVVILSENIEEKDLMMFRGAGCEITNDLSTAIYKASW
ncbi:MAG: PfkB family carbohydrate kinase [Chitinophagales bacterium]